MTNIVRRTTSFCLFLVLVTPGALAQQQRAVNDEPSAARLRADVTYLASDKLDGRRTGTPGAEKAARYIADEFKRLGLKPGASRQFNFAAGQNKSEEQQATYLQSFPYVASVEAGKGNAMAFTRKLGEMVGGTSAPALDLRVGEDWMPLAWSANGRIERSAVVYVGYGITANDLNHDDYANVDVKDKIALAFVGTPDGDNPHGAFARYNDLRFKAAATRDHGARALLLITREENFKDDKLAHLHLDDNVAGDAGLPVALISRQVARSAIEAFEAHEAALNAQSGSAPPNGASQQSAQPATGAAAPAKNFSIALNNIAFSLTTDLMRREAPAANVIGVLPGSDMKVQDELIIIGAHYDHLGRGGQGSLAAREGEIHHGADDNASGTAALLELARLFSAVRPRRTLVFIAFSGEEEGLLGSAYYVKQPARPLAQTVAMINMDMVGRLQDNKLNVGGVGTAAEWRELVGRTNNELKVHVTAGAAVAERAAAPAEVPIVTAANGQVIATAALGQRFTLALSDDGYGPSDHSSFYARQIPVLFFWTGTHEDYHKPSDTADKINYDGEARIVALVRDVVRGVDADDKRPTYTQAKSDNTQGRSMGFRVYLGTIPNYADSNDGLKLDGVRDDSPAAKAGLQAGDRIVKLAGRDIHNVYDYTYALGEMKAGQEYEVEVVRGTERLTLKLTPAARK
ncbi:MAG: M20/M25/M40 family metallo-hydrolase [Pyrinomonadaceae bacterium]